MRPRRGRKQAEQQQRSEPEQQKSPPRQARYLATFRFSYTSHILSSRSCPGLYGSSCNSDPWSHSRRYSPLPTKVRVLHILFGEIRTQPFLPSSIPSRWIMPTTRGTICACACVLQKLGDGTIEPMRCWQSLGRGILLTPKYQATGGVGGTVPLYRIIDRWSTMK